VDYDEKRLNIVAFSLHCGLHQLKRKFIEICDGIKKIKLCVLKTT